MIKIARVATVPFSLLGSRNLLKSLSKKMNLTVVCSKGNFQEEIQSCLDKPIEHIKINRKINILSDIMSVFHLYLFFRKEKFSIVHSNTPKGGIVCALASFLARVPIRIHSFTGQRWSTLTGFKRLLLMKIDSLICSLNTHLYADSNSQINFLEKNKIAKVGQVKCLGEGGFAGVDFERFNYEALIKTRKQQDKVIIGFVGRVVREKGIEELLKAFKELKKSFVDIELHLIGPLEQELDPISSDWVDYIEQEDGVKLLGFIEKPEELLIGCDLICLPSYREGFPMVILEAGALRIPALVSNIPGNVDTVVSKETGLIFDLNDHEDLKMKLTSLIENKKLREELGNNAYKRVVEKFSDDTICEIYMSEYNKLYEKIF